ncbi:Protein of unknown function [Lactobacillus helveticus CIRM-BIA 104]|uniref:Uncharacterized protein n=1 Tax=Lactobacillus helveticus CIRM-BIA 104 TaxID=1226333 RepID=U6F9W6_LACHE|nr:Protein of unknown function [Lactobacillus helveticus CIRM-BIA 104]CDI63721.1 Protein of unknown function [Lactobacillus helveticus CIRM-BIA 103]
MKLTRGAS